LLYPSPFVSFPVFPPLYSELFLVHFFFPIPAMSSFIASYLFPPLPICFFSICLCLFSPFFVLLLSCSGNAFFLSPLRYFHPLSPPLAYNDADPSMHVSRRPVISSLGTLLSLRIPSNVSPVIVNSPFFSSFPFPSGLRPGHAEDCFSGFLHRRRPLHILFSPLDSICC